ncbi:hypothetical protein ACKAV7_003347 [Fusarium commune]
MDLALTTVNLLRFPFNTTSPPGKDYNNSRYRRPLTLTDKWNIMGYLSEVLNNWKRLHEFLELADQVNQLAFVFASVDQAELYWDRMFASNMLRRRMLQAAIQNPPDKKPRNLDGNPIDPDFFARVQRAFWLHEFTLRRRILEVGWSTEQIQIPGDANPADNLQGFLQRPGDVDIRRFLGLVQSQWFVGTMVDHGIEDRRRLGFMYNRLLKWSTLVSLGIQGITFCLPSSDEKYSMQLLFQIAAVNYQSRLFWRIYDFQSPFWHDSWFEKYPVSGPIEHFSLGIDYSRLEREQDRQRE